MAREAKTAQVNLRLQPSLKEAADRAAAADRRSLTSLIEKLLADYLRDRGYAVGEEKDRSRPSDAPSAR